MNIAERAHQLLSLQHYAVADQTIKSVPDLGELGSVSHLPSVPKDQYILRMMVRCPWMDGLLLPPELEWIRSTIDVTDRAQERMGIDHPFLYVTVRSGIVRSVRDDEWHVDGFSMRIPHTPEQNYIWSNCHPTEVLKQNFDIPDDFDPHVHNLHQFFQDRATEAPVTLDSYKLYLIDPYIIHRRPQIPPNTERSFFRISYVPIEIEDDNCQHNPLMPQILYWRTPDVRDLFIRY